MVSQENNLILQSYFTASFLAELDNNNFLESDFFSKMTFGFPQIKKHLRHIKIGNQGCLLMSLYAMLVIPRQLVEDKYRSDYDQINQFLHKHLNINQNTYKDKNNYVRHIRNAVAHAKVSFQPTQVVSFYDKKSGTNEEFSADLPLSKIGNLLMELQKIHIKYINDQNLLK